MKEENTKDLGLVQGSSVFCIKKIFVFVGKNLGKNQERSGEMGKNHEKFKCFIHGLKTVVLIMLYLKLLICYVIYRYKH